MNMSDPNKTFNLNAIQKDFYFKEDLYLNKLLSQEEYNSLINLLNKISKENISIKNSTVSWLDIFTSVEDGIQMDTKIYTIDYLLNGVCIKINIELAVSEDEMPLLSVLFDDWLEIIFCDYGKVIGYFGDIWYMDDYAFDIKIADKTKIANFQQSCNLEMDKFYIKLSLLMCIIILDKLNYSECVYDIMTLQEKINELLIKK